MTTLTIGIDLGTSRTRLTRWDGSSQTEDYQFARFDTLRHGNYGPNEIPSYFAPSESNANHGAVYDLATMKTGREAFGAPDAQSVKYLPYLLGHSSDGEQYEPVRDLMQMIGKVHSPSFARTVFRRFLENIWGQCKNDFQGHTLRLILTYPATWTSNMANIYEKTVRKAWNEAKIEEVLFMHESEAVAHINHSLGYFSSVLSDTQAPLITFDLGGHTGQVSTHEVRHIGNGRVSLYPTCPSTATFGGGEYFEYKLQKLVEADLKRLHPRLTGPHMRSVVCDILQQLRAIKKGLLSNSDIGIRDPFRPAIAVPVEICQSGSSGSSGSQQSILWQPGPGALESCYLAAFNGPYEILREHLMSEQAKGASYVFCSGGSTAMDRVRKDLDSMIYSFGFKAKFLSEQAIGISTSSVVARGAIAAFKTRASVRDLFENAAFAIQTDKEDSTCVVVRKCNIPFTYTIYANGKDSSWNLICSNYPGDCYEADFSCYLDVTRCYTLAPPARDVYEGRLGSNAVCRGRMDELAAFFSLIAANYEFDVSLSSESSITITVKIAPRNLPGVTRAKVTRIRQARLPVYSDFADGNLKVDIDKLALPDLGERKNRDKRSSARNDQGFVPIVTNLPVTATEYIEIKTDEEPKDDDRDETYSPYRSSGSRSKKLKVERDTKSEERFGKRRRLW